MTRHWTNKVRVWMMSMLWDYPIEHEGHKSSQPTLDGSNRCSFFLKGLEDGQMRLNKTTLTSNPMNKNTNSITSVATVPATAPAIRLTLNPNACNTLWTYRFITSDATQSWYLACVLSWSSPTLSLSSSRKALISVLTCSITLLSNSCFLCQNEVACAINPASADWNQRCALNKEYLYLWSRAIHGRDLQMSQEWSTS